MDGLPLIKAQNLTREALLREIRGKTQHAEASIDRAGIDREARTAKLAWCSEDPYERWWGIEVLDTSPKAVRMGRLRNGAALLLGHDTDKQIGVIESASLDKDKKGRALARFSRSALGEEIFADVTDGIRQKVSVGYRIHDLVLVKKEGDVSTYRVTDWEPFELSIVSVPADDTVGVGRGLSGQPEKAKAMKEEQSRAAESSETNPDPSADVAAQHQRSEASVSQSVQEQIAERNRIILEIGDQWKAYGGQQLARDAIGNAKMTVDAFRKIVLDEVSKKQAAIAPTETGRLAADEQHPEFQRGGNPAGYGMGAREMLAATSLRAFRGIGKIMRMEDHEVAYRAGMWLMGAVHGNGKAMRWCKEHGVKLLQGDRNQLFYDERSMTEGVFTSAGWLVPVEMEAAIIANREEFGVARRICNVIPMTSASTSIPRITSDTTAYFVGEGASATPSDPAGDQVTLTLKDLMVHTNIGKSTAMDTVVSLAELVAREQARSFAVKEDQCLVIGDGTSTYGGMMGVKTLLDNTAYSAGKVDAVSGHDLMSEIDITDITSLIAVLPVYARAGSRFLVSGVFDALVFGRVKLNAGGNTVQTVQGRIVEGEFAGFPITLAHHMPTSTSTINDSTMAILGNFNLGVAFGSGSGMMMTVDPYTLAHQNLTRIITSERIDINPHGVAKSTTAGQQGPIVGLWGNT